MKSTRNRLLIAAGLITAILPTICLIASVNLLFPIPFIIGISCVFIGLARIPGARQDSLAAFGIGLCILSAAGPFALRAYLDRPGKPIKIVVPIGYLGQFSIVKDSKKGQPLKSVGGTWVFEIPESGVLRVKETYPFHMWHQEGYVYADGQRANVKSLGANAGNVQTGPNRFESSTDYDGSEQLFEVLDCELPADD